MTIFSKIISGEIPCYKIAENENFFAFLDIMPLAPGHVLVVPKKETDYIFDIADDELGAMMVFGKKIAEALKKAVPCIRIGVAVIGLEVAHAHMHLIPLNTMEDINFSRPKLKLTDSELAAVADKIRKEL